MIQKLKKKIVVVLMSVLTIMTLIMLLTINELTTRSIRMHGMDIMQEFAKRDGQWGRGDRAADGRPGGADGEPGGLFAAAGPGPAKQPDASYRDSLFCVRTDRDGLILETLYGSQALVEEDELSSMVSAALSGKKPEGTVSGWKYLIQDRPYGNILVFMNPYQENTFIRNMRLVLTATGLLALILFFVISLFLARWLIRPVDDAFSRQKQFISDSSHELKTPLTVIGANADVLESEIGENKWLSVIRSEILRMNELVGELLLLAKTENADMSVNIAPFDLSKAVMGIALSFESVAFEAKKNYELSIQEGVPYTGDESGMKKLASILIDNGLKNTCQGGIVRVSLKKEGEKIHFSVYNTGQGIPPGEQEHIFERFYRSDRSRSHESGQQGSFGLGLAIARAIVTQHRGKISVESEQGKFAVFKVVL